MKSILMKTQYFFNFIFITFFPANNFGTILAS